MNLSAAVSVLVIFLLSQPVVRGQTDWGVTYSSHQICAFKGSTVDIPCTYTYPPVINHQTTEIQSVLWFTKTYYRRAVDLGSDPDYSGRVEYLFKQNDCTLRIKDLRETDSAEYKFRFITNQREGRVTGSPGVTLTVTGLRVVVVSVWTGADLRCESSCNLSDNPSYVWYKDGEKMNVQTSSLRASDFGKSYSCALKNHEDQRSAAVLIEGWGVTYSSHQICASKGSTVDIPCTYTYPAVINHQTTKIQTVLWFTKTYYRQAVDLGSDPDYSGRVEYLFEQNDCTLRIKDLRETDSAEYKFKFTTNQRQGGVTGSPGVTLTVTGLRVVVVRVSTEADLRCESSCNLSDNPSYVWYKDGEKMNVQTSSLRVSDFGKSYSCALKNHEDQRSAAVYAPKTPSVSQSPSGEVMEGRAVTLSCSSDANPAASYTWYKVDRNQRHQLFHEGAQLVFRSIQSSDSGLYFCSAKNDMGTLTSGLISVDVKYAPKTPSVSQSPSGEVMEGRAVTLSCSSDANPAASYTWYKKTVNEGRQTDLISRKYFRSIQSSDSGEYYCLAENKLGKSQSELLSIKVKYAPTFCSVSVNPLGEIRENSRVTLTGSSDGYPTPEFTWYKRNQHGYLRKGSELVFRSIQSSDSGEYYCEAENKLGSRTSESISVKVKYAPKPPSVSVSPSGEIVEGSSVTLTCSSDANPAANYTWYKKDEDSPKASGEIFTIENTGAEHSGDYVCVAQNEKGHHNSTVHVTVVGGISTLQIHLIRLTLMLLMMTPLLLLTLWMRKKKTGSSTTEPSEPAEMMELDANPEYENVSAFPAAQTEDTEEQEDMV